MVQADRIPRDLQALAGRGNRKQSCCLGIAEEQLIPNLLLRLRAKPTGPVAAWDLPCGLGLIEFVQVGAFGGLLKQFFFDGQRGRD